MDDFAQTRGDDDLFESEISPVVPPPAVPTAPRGFTPRGRGPGRGRGRGRGENLATYPAARQDREKRTPPAQGAAASDSAPSSPVAATASATPVAGSTNSNVDRTLSGGIKKPKLTEDELAERLERAKLNNQRLVERRKKAEADENSFQVQEEARKQADVHKRLVDRRKKVEADKTRKELDDEREKNRQRKLKAVQNREWDSTKTEEDYNPRSQSSRFRRGAHGGVSGPPRGAPTGPRATTATRPPPASPPPPPPPAAAAAAPQAWPDLPPAKTSGPKVGVDASGGSQKPGGPAVAGESSWAEQVEAGSPVVSTPAAANPATTTTTTAAPAATTTTNTTTTTTTTAT